MTNNVIYTTELVYSNIWDDYRKEYPKEEYSDETLNQIIDDDLWRNQEYITCLLNERYPRGFVAIDLSYSDLKRWGMSPTYYPDAESLFTYIPRDFENFEIRLENGEMIMGNCFGYDYTVRAVTDEQWYNFEHPFGWTNAYPEELVPMFQYGKRIGSIWE